MALSGSCATSAWQSGAVSASLVFNWTATQDQPRNQSTLSWDVRAAVSEDNVGVTLRVPMVKINGGIIYSSSAPPATFYNRNMLGSGTTTLTHNADGSCSFTVEISVLINTTPQTGNDSFTLDAHTVYSLSISAGTGSTITVKRTSSGYASTGNLSNGARLYKGDTLKISFAVNSNYTLATHKVNNSTFSSGGTHTVSGNVSVVSTATAVKSTIGATDANIGSNSTITVTRYNSNYTHTITYALGLETGTIVTRGSNTSISWTVPVAFYAQIPNAKTGTCTLTCETFNGNTSLGTSTCTLTVTASAASSAPTVSGVVIDTNATTVALTGDSSTLIRYKSNAQCTITATANNSATISGKYVNDLTPTNNIRTFSGVSATSFTFKATDSRGYTSTQTITPTIIAYINLTCNPIIARVTSTGSEVAMTFSGDYFRGSFGAYNNTLTIRYRYRKSTEPSYGAWASVSASSYTIGTNTYSTNSAISLGNTFDYRDSYVFQVQAYDGANGTTLTTVTKTVTLQGGVPVFDWGENDFNVNVRFMQHGVDTIGGPSQPIYLNNGVFTPCASTPTFGPLDETSWEDISFASRTGIAASIWDVGDTKSVALSGTLAAITLNTTLYAFILGFDHNALLEGGRLIHFQLGKTAVSSGTDVCLTDSYYASFNANTVCFNMNRTAWSTIGGWQGSDMRNDVCGTDLTSYAGTFIGVLPQALRAVLKTVTKYSNNLGGTDGQTSPAAVTPTQEVIFLLSQKEVYGVANNSNPAEDTYQAQYAYYAAGNSLVKYQHDSPTTPAHWWLRSQNKAGTSSFLMVAAGGGSTAGTAGAHYSSGFAPAFCV